MPIYSGGNVDGSIRRAAELCQGRLPAKIGPDKIREGRQVLARYAQAAGRDPSTITTALQSIVCPGDTPEQARERFENSAFDLFRVSLQKIIGSRSPERVAAAAASCAEAAAFLGAGVPVRGMTNAEAAQAADVVIAAVPWEGHASLLTSLPAPLAAVASWGVNRPW